METIVTKVLSDLVIKVEVIWTYYGQKGRLIKIAGLLPSDFNNRKSDIELLRTLLTGKKITINKVLYSTSNTLIAFVNFNGKPLQSYFTEREIPDLEPSRFTDPDEKRPITKIVSGIISSWKNPLRYSPQIDALPCFDNIKYPVKPWEPSYQETKELADALFSPTHSNKQEIDRWVDHFLDSPQREAPFIIAGDVGIGKSWFLAERLMRLPQESYHKIIIDLRYTMRAEDLSEAMQDEILEFLNHYIKGVDWLIPDFESILGKDFDINNDQIKRIMHQKAIEYLTLPPLRYLRKKIRYYSLPNTPDLIVVFDNIDHFDDTELLTILDMCRRIIGYVDGVKVIMAIRPSTILPKARTGVSLGDSSVHHVVLKSPNIYDVLCKRFSTNTSGVHLDINRKITQTSMSYSQLLTIYKKSDHIFGLARLLKELCYTDSIPSPEDIFSMTQENINLYNDSFDLRHYLKLFRTVVRSNNLMSLENIGKIYYGIHALVLKSNEPMSESKSYLFNLFDNELPDMRGNALIRYRVLEYCKKFKDLSEGTFDLFFDGLGYGANIARNLISVFAEAGLVSVKTVENTTGKVIPIRAEITTAGERHLEIITSLWYIICVKTGMNIYSDYILYGDEAKDQASQFVSNKAIVDDFARRGWVPEKKFIRFLMNQEYLEYKRVGQYCETHPDFQQVLVNFVSQLDSPAHNIHFSYHQQIINWNKAKRK